MPSFKSLQAGYWLCPDIILKYYHIRYFFFNFGV
jgi:hypothetical protein